MARLTAALACILLADCSATPAETGVPTADCSVCAYYNDLACLHVPIKDGTPSAEYGGRTYYFCGDGCRAEFLEMPDRFVQH